MSQETNKEVVRQFIKRIFEGLDAEAVDELVADDFVTDSFPPPKNGKQELRDSTARMAKALDQIHFDIEDMIAEDDRVAVRLKAGARQIGEFGGMPATNRSYEIGEIHIFRLRDGKVVEHWHEYNPMAIMKQLKGE